MPDVKFASRCPHCGGNTDRALGVDGPPPRPGDLALCSHCGEWCQFDVKLKSQRPEPQALAWLQRNPIAQKLHKAWLQLARQQRRQH